ncbi:MAG: hypothetical protein ACKOC5_05885 [Chloroflexota bacterium]
MQIEPVIRRTYILRVIEVDRDGRPVMFVSIEDSLTGQKKAFARLADLVAYLEQAAPSGLPEMYPE